MSKLNTGLVCAVVAIAGLAGGASADLTNEVFVLSAQVGGQNGSFMATLEDGYFDNDGNFFWTLDSEIEIQGDNGDVLATLSGASLIVMQDPVISMNFNVQAANQNTIFSVHSGLLSFAQIASPIGAASAGVTVTDINGNGATLSPDGSSIYASQYNGNYPNGTPFADLLNSAVSAGAFQTGSASDEYPGGGNFVSIGVPVDSMSAAWTFTLSPYDVASGTSTFVVIPNPAGASLLGLAGLAACRRRR
ncbi:MAG: hypothetical protein IT431_15340 [Phycisphaerales bacterium]|nr:hypothetical protein [Phycisphaerales bacterium]